MKTVDQTQKRDSLDASMKTGTHPTSQKVVFKDTSSEAMYLITTTMSLQNDDTIKYTDGNTYPVVEVEVTSSSHPFYTGDQRIMDTAGRADKFYKRVKKAEELKSQKTEEVSEVAK